jgi:hypothetical protein
VRKLKTLNPKHVRAGLVVAVCGAVFFTLTHRDERLYQISPWGAFALVCLLYIIGYAVTIVVLKAIIRLWNTWE